MNDQDTQEPNPPVTVIIPNITREKMEAVRAIALSNLEVAKALSATNPEIEISNCYFDCAEGATGVTIRDEE